MLSSLAAELNINIEIKLNDGKEVKNKARYTHTSEVPLPIFHGSGKPYGAENLLHTAHLSRSLN